MKNTLPFRNAIYLSKLNLVSIINLNLNVRCLLQYARYREQITPEGHRAPLADLLRATRSVNTQTPATDLPSSSYSSGNYSLHLIVKISR